ncbi:MAG: VWA domain-containing protein [Spirochaetaceae bacterium]|nr:VWA domain-containing protein [Spirochaetaceae bacterium]
MAQKVFQNPRGPVTRRGKQHIAGMAFPRPAAGAPRRRFCFTGTGVFFAGFCLLALARVPAQDLSITPGDVRIEVRSDSGYHLFIRKKAGLGSVLITETTRDPALQADNYAYRAAEWNAVNGDEIRMLNGAVLPPSSRIYSLIDSTPEIHPELGEAFHIFLPYLLYYGYTGARYGEVYVADGTYLNLRAFELPYADYRGRFRDNPYVLRFIQEEQVPGGNYREDTREAFTEITRSGGGNLVYSAGPDDLLDRLRALLEHEAGNSLDLVICLDTTSSMGDDIEAIRTGLTALLEELLPAFPEFRIGMVLYKDYNDEYLTRVIPFTGDFAAFRRSLDGIRARGGRDIPEAVYEALYDGAVKFPWEARSRLMILIGDAPPHPRPRGRITKEMAHEEAAARNVRVSAIILPE